MKLRRPPARNAVTFVIACLAALTMLFISEASTWRARRSLLEISVIGQARAGIQQLDSSLRDAVASAPGGVALQTPVDAARHAQARNDIDLRLSMLTAHYADDPAGAALLAVLRSDIEQRLDRLPGGAAVSGPTPAERMPLASVRAATAALLAHERQKQLVEQQAVDGVLQIGRIGIAALSAISLLSLSLFLWQAAAFQRQQRALQTLERVDRDRLEEEVARRTAELTELHRHLISAREDERARLARDLHDDLGALLTSAKLDAARLRSRLGPEAPEAQERLASLVRMLDGVIALKRRIVEDLRPSALDTVGLVAALEILAREFAERSGLQVTREFAPMDLNPEVELVLFRLVQEATTNIAKHAKARHVGLVLRVDRGETVLRVSDDGVGFDAGRALLAAHGLAGMRFRVQAERGKMTVDSKPGVGTTIEVRLPHALAVSGVPVAA